MVIITVIKDRNESSSLSRMCIRSTPSNSWSPQWNYLLLLSSLHCLLLPRLNAIPHALECGYGNYCDFNQLCYSCCTCNFYQDAIEGYCPTERSYSAYDSDASVCLYLTDEFQDAVNAIVTYVIIAVVVFILICVGIIVACCGGVAACCGSCGAKPAPATPAPSQLISLQPLSTQQMPMGQMQQMPMGQPYYGQPMQPMVIKHPEPDNNYPNIRLTQMVKCNKCPWVNRIMDNPQMVNPMHKPRSLRYLLLRVHQGKYLEKVNMFFGNRKKFYTTYNFKFVKYAN